MIKVRLVPNFLFCPHDMEDNWVLDADDVRRVFYIECELPCLPPVDTVIPFGSIRDEIFNQYSHLLLRFNEYLYQAIDDIRNRIDDKKYEDSYWDLREEYPNLKNASNADILRAVIYDDFGDSVYRDFGIVKVDDITMIPNDEMVYIKLIWNL